MQKLMGFLFIMSGCCGLGFWYSCQFRMREKNLKEMCTILEILLGEIRYGKSSLPECCLRLSERLKEPYKTAFFNVYERDYKNSGDSFAQMAEEEFTILLKDMVIKQEDRTEFISCFTNLGYQDGEMQLRNIINSKNSLEHKLQALLKENVSKCRLAISLGTMSGLLIVILFL